MNKCVKFECRSCEDGECCSGPLHEDCSNDCPCSGSCSHCVNFDDNDCSCTLIIEEDA